MYGLFDVLQVPKGQYLLSNGANSSLGRELIKLGRHYGVKTINLVRKREYVEELKSIGCATTGRLSQKNL